IGSVSRYWAFYIDRSNIVWRTSLDGSSWSGTTSVRTGLFGDIFSTWNDCANSKVYYAYAASTTTFQHRARTLNSDGTISWDYAEVSITGSFGTEREPTIAKDSSGILWIAFVSYKTGGSKGDYLEVWKCTISGTNCGTGSNWATMAPFPAQLNSASAATVHGPQILPLTSGKLSLMYTKGATGGSGIAMRTYTGSAWNAEAIPGTNPPTYTTQEIAALAISDTTYFAGVCVAFGSCSAAGNILYWSCAYPCSTIPASPTTLSSATTNNNVVISSDNSQQLVVAYGAAGPSTSILYRVSTDGGSSWQTEQTLASSESVTADTLTASYTIDSNSKYEFLWEAQGPCACNVRFATFANNNAYTGSLAESPTISDTAGKLFQGLRSEAEPISSTLTDAIAKAAGKFLSE